MGGSFNKNDQPLYYGYTMERPMSSYSMSQSSSMNNGMKSVSESTNIVNGKVIKTTRTLENGLDVVIVEENGKVVSKTIDGVYQKSFYDNSMEKPVSDYSMNQSMMNDKLYAINSSQSSSMNNGMKYVSESTNIVNGKVIKTTRTLQNGIETVIVEENGRVVSKTINGDLQKFI